MNVQPRPPKNVVLPLLSLSKPYGHFLPIIEIMYGRVVTYGIGGLLRDISHVGALLTAPTVAT